MVSTIGLQELADTMRRVGGKKSEIAYGIIKRAIIFRNFEPGRQLREQELAQEFACSQGTIREALMRLGEDGLVQRSGYHGTRVTDIGHTEAAEMVRVRLSIERTVATQLARTGLDHAREPLDAIIAEMDESHGKEDLFSGSELDRAFHSQLARAAGLGLLSPILERCSLHIHRFTLSSLEVPREFFQESGVGNEHRALLEDLSSGDVPRAQAAIAGHLAHVVGRWSPSLYDAVGDAAFHPNHPTQAA